MLMTSLIDKQPVIGDSDSSLMKAEPYFLTICTHGRQSTLGKIKDGQMILNTSGSLVEEEWLRTAATIQNIELDAYVVMPNHFHAIFWLSAGDPAGDPVSENNDSPPYSTDNTRVEITSAEDVVQVFKAAVTDRAQRLYDMPDAPFWQPSFHAHRVRQKKALPSLRNYIQNNPAGWSQDSLNPAVGDPSCAIIPPSISG